MPSERELVLQARAWPFEEARKLVARYAEKPPAKGYVLFETGYGPSGLPHIGTFGEVARTTMVRHAFRALTDDKVKFGFDTSDLSPEARAALDEFAAKLAADNKSVYIEIQGHNE